MADRKMTLKVTFEVIVRADEGLDLEEVAGALLVDADDDRMQVDDSSVEDYEVLDSK